MERIFGGSPAAVLLRLIIISIIVGIVLKALGVRPQDLLRSFDEFVYSLRFLGVDALQWFMLGAIIVFPVWAVVRLLKVLGGGGKSGK
jgi:hypothetical protein